jgi:hypothetical protein
VVQAFQTSLTDAFTTISFRITRCCIWLKPSETIL